MKTKSFLFLLICISTFNWGFSEQPQPQKPGSITTVTDSLKYWSFVKDRLFDGESKKVLKYSSDIHVRLTGNPSIADSIIVSDLIDELKKLISTNKISLVKTGGNLVLNFNNKPEGEYISYKTRTGIGQNFDQLRTRSSKLRARSVNYENTNEYKHLYARYDTVENDYSSVNINFNDSIRFADRKKYIEYEIIHSLCVIEKKGRATSPYFTKGPILDKPYWNSDPLKTEFNEMDKFLLSKLYSVDLLKQFKVYLIKSTSWHSYMIFVNKAFMRSIGISIGITLVILVLLLSYKPVFRRNFKRPYFNYLIPGIVVSVSVYLINSFYHYFTSSSSNLIIEMSLNLIPVVVLSVLISTPLFYIEKLLIKPELTRLVQAGLKMFLIFIFVTLLSLIKNPSTPSWAHELFNFITIGIILAIGRGVLMFIEYSEELKVLETDTAIIRLKELKTKAEMQSLQSRINPHFLYNSLNSIAGLARSDPDKTEKMALSLSDMFRYSINRKEEQMNSIKEEVFMVRSYLEIEKIRFGERLSFEIEADETIESLCIPRFILQPLVENSIKHGVSNVEGKGIISISVKKEEKMVVITVGDNGPGFPEGLVSGYGLQSLYDLLNLTYGESAEVNWQNSPVKLIRVTLPIV